LGNILEEPEINSIEKIKNGQIASEFINGIYVFLNHFFLRDLIILYYFIAVSFIHTVATSGLIHPFTPRNSERNAPKLEPILEKIPTGDVIAGTATATNNKVYPLNVNIPIQREDSNTLYSNSKYSAHYLYLTNLKTKTTYYYLHYSFRCSITAFSFIPEYELHRNKH
jgi:hypothetical protein